MNAPRARAAEEFRAVGVPHRRVEAWKYSDLRSVLSAEKVETTWGAGYSESVPLPVEKLEFAPDGLPEWAVARMNSVTARNAMDAAARAFARGDSVFRVPQNARPDHPVELKFFTPGHARIVMFVEAGAEITLCEIHEARREGLQNISLSIFLGPGARLTHVRRAPQAGNLVSMETIAVIQDKDSLYRAHLANFGAKMSRTEVHVALNGEGAEAHLSGTSVLSYGSHADVTTHIDHAVGDTRSTQLFKLVAGGNARGVYQGKVTVREGADGSDSRQTAKGLLLAERAEIDLKPELEIFADDVKCAHGAAVGDLDAESLFYLRARGIPEDEARATLIRAFLEEPLAEVEDEAMRALLSQAIEDALPHAMVPA